MIRFVQLCLFIVIFFGQEKDQSLDDILREKADSLWIEPLNNTAFKVGERLEFEINLKLLFTVTAGYTTMSIPDTVYYRGRACYRVLVLIRSTDFISNFYTLKDTIESYIDMEYGMTWYYSKRTRESGYFRDLYVHYDHAKDSASVKEIRYKDEEGRKVKSRKKYKTGIATFTHDILSSFYILRAQKIESGYPIEIPVNSLKTNYALAVTVNPPEKESVEAGRFNAFMLKPKIKGENIIRNAEDMRVFISTDKAHLPIQMTTELAIGSVNVELAKYSGVDRN